MSNIISHALFNPKVQERTNIYLKSQGYQLQTQTPEDKSRKPFIEVVSTHTQKPIGIRITHSPSSKEQGDMMFVKTGAWYDFEKEEDSAGGNIVLKNIAQAEARAHAQVQDQTKPSPYAISTTGINTTLKGRLAQSNWYQNSGDIDGEIPEPNPVKAIKMTQNLEFVQESGTLLRIPEGDYLTQNLEGKIGAESKEARLGILNVDRNEKGNSVNNAALRALKGLKTLKENPEKSIFAVMEEQIGGQSSIISQDEKGTLKTWKTYGWKEAAETALTRNYKELENKHNSNNKNHQSVSRLAKAFEK